MKVVAILGGMGPHAGADLLNKFLAACAKEIRNRGDAVDDQAYPVHYLAQWPHPDRTQALLSGDEAQRKLLASLSDSIATLEKLDATAIAIACNTAHAWHQQLKALHPKIDLLHIAEVTATAAARKSLNEVALLATTGTCKAQLYQRPFAAKSIRCHEPDRRELDLLMAGIYQGVKGRNLVFAEQCFKRTLQSMRDRTGANAFVLGCTEIPMVLTDAVDVSGATLLDPTVELGQALARLAYAR